MASAQRFSAASNAGSQASSRCAMPGHWEPCPGKTKTSFFGWPARRIPAAMNGRVSPGEGVELLRELLARRARHAEPMVVVVAAEHGRGANVDEIGGAVAAQKIAEASGHLLQRLRRARGERQQVGERFGARSDLGDLRRFQHHVGVDPAQPERAHAGHAPTLARGPAPRLDGHLHRELAPGDMGLGSFKCR